MIEFTTEVAPPVTAMTEVEVVVPFTTEVEPAVVAATEVE